MRPVVIFEFFPQGAVSLGLPPNGTWNSLKPAATSSSLSMGVEQSPGCYLRHSTIANVLAIHRLQA